MAKQIFFYTLPSCGACKQQLPVVQQIAQENGAELFIMDSKSLHPPEVVFLPSISVFDDEDNETFLQPPIRVGEIERGLGVGNFNFLNSITKIPNAMENYFNGIVKIDQNGNAVAVSYDDGNNEMRNWIFAIILAVCFLVIYFKFYK
jgi:thiol-disulfide isomerase/thioredoxin